MSCPEGFALNRHTQLCFNTQESFQMTMDLFIFVMQRSDLNIDPVAQMLQESY